MYLDIKFNRYTFEIVDINELSKIVIPVCF